MFKWVYNEYGAPQSRISGTPANDGEAFSFGEAVKFATGKLTKASATDPIAGFTMQALTAGTGQTLEWTEAREGDVFQGDYTGTPAAGFVAGANAVAISTDGLNIDSATVASGAIAVTSINTNTLKARMKVKNRQLS